MRLKRTDRTFFWIIVAASIFVAVLVFAILTEAGMVPATAEFCDKDEYTNQKYCTPHSTPFFIVLEVVKFLQEGNAVITALATVVIAWFTVTLASVGRQQGKDMRRSIAAANRQARAAQAALIHAREIDARNNRPWLEMSVTKAGYFQKNGGMKLVSIPIDVTLKNHGPTPAMSAQIICHVVVAKRFELNAEIEDALARSTKPQPITTMVFPRDKVVIDKSSYGVPEIFRPDPVDILPNSVETTMLIVIAKYDRESRDLPRYYTAEAFYLQIGSDVTPAIYSKRR